MKAVKTIKQYQTAYCHLIIDNKVWFASATYNALFYYDLLGEHLTYIGKFPGEEDNRSSMFSCMYFYKNRIFFFPYSANLIHIYNIEQHSFEKQIELNFDTYWKYALGLQINNVVYLFSAQTAEISTFSLDSQTIKIIGQVDIDNENKSYVMSFWNNCFKVEEYIYTCLSERSIILRINTTTNEIAFKKFDESDLGFVGVVEWDNKVLFIQRTTGKIFTWEGESDYLLDREFFTPSQINLLLEPRKYGCAFFATRKSKIIAVPDSDSWMMELKIVGKRIQLIHFSTMNEEISLDGKGNSRINIWNNVITFVSGTESNIWFVESDSTISKKQIMPPEDFFEQNYKYNYLYAMEDLRICSLDRFLDSIEERQSSKQQSKIGQEIYLNIKEKI